MESRKITKYEYIYKYLECCRTKYEKKNYIQKQKKTNGVLGCCGFVNEIG